MREEMARLIFHVAIRDGQCAALWDCLTEGGSATVRNGQLVMVDAAMLRGFGSDPSESEEPQTTS